MKIICKLDTFQFFSHFVSSPCPNDLHVCRVMGWKWLSGRKASSGPGESFEAGYIFNELGLEKYKN